AILYPPWLGTSDVLLSGAGILGLVDRQKDGESAAFARNAVDEYPSAMGLDDVFHNGKSQPRPPGVVNQPGAAPIELVKDFPLFGSGNPYTRVCDFDGDILTPRLRPNRNPLNAARIFHRIIQQVENCLRHCFAIDEGPW